MKAKWIPALGFAVVMAQPGPAHATLTISVADNGVPVAGCSVTGASPQSASCSDANFSSIGVTVQGVPTIPSPDLGTISISATAGPLAVTDVLDIVVSQAGLSNFAGGTGSSTFTYNSLIGLAGPVDYSTIFNGSQIATDILGPALNPQTGGPFFVNLAPITGAFTDGQEIAASFGPSLQIQQLEADAQFQVVGSVVPEPASLVLLGSALIMFFGAVRRA